jgi:hypothetical protein
VGNTSYVVKMSIGWTDADGVVAICVSGRGFAKGCMCQAAMGIKEGVCWFTV